MIKLLKPYNSHGKTYPPGTICRLDDEQEEKLIRSGVGEVYTDASRYDRIKNLQTEDCKPPKPKGVK